MDYGALLAGHRHGSYLRYGWPDRVFQKGTSKDAHICSEPKIDLGSAGLRNLSKVYKMRQISLQQGESIKLDECAL
jgi:hypothetical protein